MQPDLGPDQSLTGWTPAAADMVLREEHLRVSTRMVTTERVRLVRRIITETRMVPVEVRHEVVELERVAADSADGALDDPAIAHPTPVVMVLHEEVPVITTVIRAVERVTLEVREVSGEIALKAEVSAEHVEVINEPLAAPTA